MNLLEEFVFSLSKTERRKLRPLQFRGTKRKIFLKILACHDSAGIDSANIIKIYKLTGKRYNQMSAEMLAACYHDVASLGGTKLLQYLGNRQLYRHFYKEMQRQEEALRRDRNQKELEDFYFKVLLMSEFFLIPQNLAGKMQGEIGKYLHRYAALKDPHPCDKCFIRCAEIDHEISENFARNFSLKKLRASTEELEEIFECVKGQDHALAKFKVTYTLITICFGNFLKEKKPDPYIAYMDKIIDEYADTFGSVAGLIKLGVQSYTPPKEADIEHYKQFLQHPSPTGEGSSLLFIERFLPLIVKAGDYAWVKKFIAGHFPNNIHQLRKDMAVHWWRLLLISYIYSGKYEEAEACLRNAFSANTGNGRNIDLAINLRCFDVFLTVMKEGPGLASEFAMRQIRYANRHGYNKGEGFMMMFLKATYNLVRYPVFDKAHSRKVMQDYLAELGGEERLYSLFEKIYDKYFL